jgi:hypothetical protein
MLVMAVAMEAVAAITVVQVVAKVQAVVVPVVIQVTAAVAAMHMVLQHHQQMLQLRDPAVPVAAVPVYMVTQTVTETITQSVHLVVA